MFIDVILLSWYPGLRVYKYTCQLPLFSDTILLEFIVLFSKIVIATPQHHLPFEGQNAIQTLKNTK